MDHPPVQVPPPRMLSVSAKAKSEKMILLPVQNYVPSAYTANIEKGMHLHPTQKSVISDLCPHLETFKHAQFWQDRHDHQVWAITLDRI